MFPRLPRLGPRTRYAVGVALLSIAFYVAGRYNITAADIVTGIWNFVLIVWGLARWEPSPSPATKVADTAVSTSTYVVNHQIMPTLTSTTSSNELNGTTMCPLKSAPAFDINSTSPAIFTNMTALTAATSVQVFEVTTKTIVAAKQPIKITETSIGSVAATLVQAVNITKQTDAAPKQAVNATNQNPKTCPNPHYEVQILSYSPLVIYIKNFVTTAEREHLISLAANKYDRSHVIETGTKFDIVEGRTSSTAILEKGDPVVDCIRLRAAHFQGKSNATDIESLNVVRYEKTQKFDYHFDWFPELPREEIDAWDRWTSFFVFLDADGTVGGTTHFPNVRMPEDTDAGLCEYIECEKGLRSLAVKPIAGNAVFWVNRLPGGKGDKRSLHSGRPVLDGTKIGMNIWTSALARDLYVDETNKVF